MANPRSSVYHINALSGSMGCPGGHWRVQDSSPEGPEGTVVAYKTIGSITNTDKHHTQKHTTNDMSGVRYLIDVIGWHTAKYLSALITVKVNTLVNQLMEVSIKKILHMAKPNTHVLMM